MGWPKGKPRDAETRAKMRQSIKARPDCLENAMRALEAARQSPRFRVPEKARTRPLPGTKERKAFDKIASVLGAAAAHAELRRGANG